MYYPVLFLLPDYRYIISLLCIYVLLALVRDVLPCIVLVTGLQVYYPSTLYICSPCSSPWCSTMYSSCYQTTGILSLCSVYVYVLLALARDVLPCIVLVTGLQVYYPSTLYICSPCSSLWCTTLYCSCYRTTGILLSSYENAASQGEWNHKRGNYIVIRTL